MRSIELTGAAPDSDCLHCAIRPFIDKFLSEHPGKCPKQVLGELAETIGELIGSSLYNSGKPEQLPQAIAFVSRIATQKARELLSTIERHKPGRSQ